jgi:hypothetical protein
MVPVRGFPGCGGMAADAIGRSGNVSSSLTGRGASVMAIGAIGRGGKSAVVHTRCWQPTRGFVTRAAGGLRLNMSGWFTHCG